MLMLLAPDRNNLEGTLPKISPNAVLRDLSVAGTGLSGQQGMITIVNCYYWSASVLAAEICQKRVL